jgi:hypothetical protein
LALAAEKSGQTSAVTAGALNAKGDDWPEFLCPRQKAGVAAWVGFDLELAEVAAQSIFRPGDMRVLVGVDSYGHLGWNVCDTQFCHRPPLLDGIWWSAAGRADTTAMELLPTSYEVTARSAPFLHGGR